MCIVVEVNCDSVFVVIESFDWILFVFIIGDLVFVVFV